MNEEYIYLELPPYLAQWLIHENEGEPPIELPRLGTEYKILEVCLIKRPRNIPRIEPNDAMVPIRIPEFRYKPARYFNYLPAKAMEQLAICIRNRFIIQFWQDMNKLAYLGQRRDERIETWMQCHGIENNDTNWNAIAKIYQRQQGNYRVRKHRARKRKLR